MADSSKRGAPGEHIAPFPSRPVPRSPVDATILALIHAKPIDGTNGQRDGRRAKIVELFDGRVPYGTIRMWRHGKRHLPQWAADLLSAKAEAHNTKIAALRESLREYTVQRPRGNPQALRAWRLAQKQKAGD